MDEMDHLARILFGHAAFQYLNAGSELGLFDLLHERERLPGAEIAAELKLAPRPTDILLLGCTALRLTGKEDGHYVLGPGIAALIQAGQWQQFKDTIAFEQHIVYAGQKDFTASLVADSNIGLRHIGGRGETLYQRLSHNPDLERVFYTYMHSWSELANRELAAVLKLSGARRVLDCGGGDAVNAIVLAKSNPQLDVTVFEIPAAAEIAARNIAEAGVAEQVSVVSGDMFTDPFPAGHDCVLFAHQLVIWTLEENTELLRKAYEFLPAGGRVVIFNSMSNDRGDGPVVAALDSVYFASIPAAGGMIYSWEQHEQCLRDAQFTQIERTSCAGWTPHGIIVARK